MERKKRQMKRIPDGEDKQQPPGISARRQFEASVLMPFSDRCDRKGETGAKEERGSDKPVEKIEDFLRECSPECRIEKRVDDMRLDHDDHRPAAQAVDENVSRGRNDRWSHAEGVNVNKLLVA